MYLEKYRQELQEEFPDNDRAVKKYLIMDMGTFLTFLFGVKKTMGTNGFYLGLGLIWLGQFIVERIENRIPDVYEN